MQTKFINPKSSNLRNKTQKIPKRTSYNNLPCVRHLKVENYPPIFNEKSSQAKKNPKNPSNEQAQLRRGRSSRGAQPGAHGDKSLLPPPEAEPHSLRGAGAAKKRARRRSRSLARASTVRRGGRAGGCCCLSPESIRTARDGAPRWPAQFSRASPAGSSASPLPTLFGAPWPIGAGFLEGGWLMLEGGCWKGLDVSFVS